MASNQAMQSVMVIGGCGFLGHHIVQQLLEEKATKISVLDLRTTKNRFPGVDYYDGDITSRDDVLGAFNKVKPQVIIHTASPTALLNNLAIFEKVNVEGTRNILECAGSVGTVKAFVYTSSASVIHDGHSDLVFADESYPVLRTPQQTEIYSHTKGVADDLVLESNRKYGNMLTACIRPAGIFGEGDVQILPAMLDAYRAGQTRFQLGDNTNEFDFTYVGNVALAHILAARALIQTSTMALAPLDHEKVDGEAFFVTNDAPYKFWDFTRAVWRAAGDTTRPEQVWVIPKGLGLLLASLMEWAYWLFTAGRKEPKLKRKAVKFSSMNRTYRIEKIKKRLGYRPRVGMQEAIERGVAFLEKERAERERGEGKKVQ
jgi:sterol-4alpha-carboxylate 3-dehydrogenase (decarboxylating)